MKKPLQNVTLRIATFEIENVIKFKKTHFIRHSGYLADFMLLLQESLGFNCELFEDVIEGIKLKNGTWNGRNGRVQSKEADIGFPTGITYDRLEAVDYTNVYNILRVNFYTAKPDELSKMLAIIYPFNIWVWIMSLIIFIFAGISFHCIINYNRRLSRKTQIKFSSILWALFGSFTNKDHPIFEVDRKSRLMIFSWIISLFVLTASYSGAIMSFLIHSGHETVPHTYEELITTLIKDEYRAGALFHTGVGKNVEDATKSTSLIFWVKKLTEEGKILHIGPNDDVYEFLLRKKFALIIYEPDGLMYMSALGADNYIISKDALYVQYEILAIPKKFRYKKHFNKAIRKVVESGLFIQTLKYQINKLRYKKVVSMKDESSKPLLFEDLIGTFSLLLIGYVLSTTVFLLELSTKFWRK